MPGRSPLISIITVVFNDFTGLVLTRDSISSQTFMDFEWVVIDGESKDGTVEFLQKCEQPGLRWVSEKDQGIYDAMNKGVSLCTSKYVVFMNAGDTFASPDILERVRQTLTSANGCDIDVLFGGANLIFGNGRTYNRSPRVVKKYLWHGLPGNHQASYYRRDLLVRMPYELKYQVCGDYYLAAKICSVAQEIRYLDYPLCNFHFGGTSSRRLIRVFVEPYLIQRDVLKISLPLRLLSIARRGVSFLVGFIMGGGKL